MRPLLTTQQAADLLNVSQEYMASLLHQGEVQFTKTFGHYRMRREDVLAYKEQREAKRREDLTELVRFTEEELGGYDELNAAGVGRWGNSAARAVRSGAASGRPAKSQI